MGVDCCGNGLNIQIALINNIVEEAVKHGADNVDLMKTICLD